MTVTLFNDVLANLSVSSLQRIKFGSTRFAVHPGFLNEALRNLLVFGMHHRAIRRVTCGMKVGRII